MAQAGYIAGCHYGFLFGSLHSSINLKHLSAGFLFHFPADSFIGLLRDSFSNAGKKIGQSLLFAYIVFLRFGSMDYRTSVANRTLPFAPGNAANTPRIFCDFL